MARATEHSQCCAKRCWGGYRLLGLFSTRYRLWSRMRFLIVGEWESNLPKGPFWSGRGKPSTRAVLEYLLQDELVKATKTWGLGLLEIYGKPTS